MIIEAGYDLAELLAPHLFATPESKQALWVLAMDEDLRELFVVQASPRYEHPLSRHVPELLEALKCDYGHSKYFALAHMLPRVGSGIEMEIHIEDEPVIDAMSAAGHEMLGRLVFDGEWTYSSAPRYSFRDYPSRDELPRAAVFHGPHPFGDCRCPACVQYDQKLAANREKYRLSIAESAGEQHEEGR